MNNAAEDSDEDVEEDLDYTRMSVISDLSSSQRQMDQSISSSEYLKKSSRYDDQAIYQIRNANGLENGILGALAN